MDTFVEVHSVTRATQKQSHVPSKKKSADKTETYRIEHLSQVFNNVKSQLHARLVTSVLDIVKKNEKFRCMTNRCFEHIPIMALCMDSNISEHSHLFNEVHEQLAARFNSIVIKLDTPDQYSSIHNILKATKLELAKFYPEKEDANKSVYFQLSQFVTSYNQLKESEKRPLIFIVPEFESIQMSIFENLITLLGLQIQSISISFVLGLSGGDHSLQRLVSSRVASKLSIDTIYDSSARKYYEYIIKSVFLSENDSQHRLSITVEQLRFVDHGYFETFSLAWLEHALKFILFSDCNNQPAHPLNICLFNAIYVSCNQLPNHPLGRYRSAFYEHYLSNNSIFSELTLSVNAATQHQLETCLTSFLEHQCNQNASCLQSCQLGKKIFIEQQQQQQAKLGEEQSSLSNTLRSVGDRKLNRYREQVLVWLKIMCDIFNVSMAKTTPTKITDSLLRERLMPMTRATFIGELTDTAHWKQGKTPDLALLHRVYAESGTKIPLNDWFQSFSSSVEDSEFIDESMEKSILARFVHGLAELDYLGFTKTSLQRSYHATKLTWDT